MSRKFIVNPWNNFCRVFEIPKEYPPGFCFGGGIRTNFQMVDFFYPIPGIPQAGVTKKEWEEKVGSVSEQEKEINLKDLEEKLLPFLQQKQYTKTGRQYLILYSFGGSTVFTVNEMEIKEEP